MQSVLKAGMAVAFLAATGAVPASALPMGFDPGLASAASMPLTTVQFRGGGHGGGMRFIPHGGGFRGGGFHGGGRRFGGGFGGGRRFGGGFGGGHRFGGYRGGRGFGVGAGVAGLAAGALIGGAIASQAYPGYGYGYGGGYDVAPPPEPVGGDPSAYCAQRFKSYDPSSGTYLGYDGQRHPCP